MGKDKAYNASSLASAKASKLIGSLTEVWRVSRSRIAAGALAVALLAIPAAGKTGAPAEKEQVSGNPSGAFVPSTPPKAEQIAMEIGVFPLVGRLRTLEAGCNQIGCMSVKELALHQQITEAVVVASLDIDGVLAKIDDERAEIMELRRRLSLRRNRNIGLLSMANIITGTGSGIIGTAMQFNNRTSIPGDAVGVAGGVAGVFLSILGLDAHAGEGSLGAAPSMLGPLLEGKTSGHSAYPHDFWAYLNTPPASNSRDSESPRQELIDNWVREKQIGQPGAPSSQKKINLLTSKLNDRKRMSLKVLTDRNLMLLELSARVSLMARSLRDLMKAIAISPGPQVSQRPETTADERANSGAP